MSDAVILNEPVNVDGKDYPAGVPVELEPATVAERLVLHGKAVWHEVEEVVKTVSDLLVDELKAALREAEVEFSSSALKPELVELLENHQKAVADAEAEGEAKAKADADADAVAVAAGPAA